MKIYAGILLLVVAVLLCGSPLRAAEFEKSYDFALNEWLEIDSTDGPVTLHRIRLNPKETRIKRSALQRPFNSEFLETVQIQLEYTNEGDRQWEARIEVRWLDAEGEIIDGYGANEDLDKRSAREVANVSLSTLKYGLRAAKTLQVKINFER
jgi:hypothetical protein